MEEQPASNPDPSVSASPVDTGGGVSQGDDPLLTSTADQAGAPISMTQRPADLPMLDEHHLSAPERRRVKLPILLFLATCLSTFHAGVVHWSIMLPNAAPGDSWGTLRWMTLTHWQDGLFYMLAILAILIAHEMGHFVATLIYRIPASLPFFIPFLAPIGTMGAVIAMAGNRANRKQIFDIGIAGPLAGLVVAIPIMIVGVKNLVVNDVATQQILFDVPWGMRLCMRAFHSSGADLRALSVDQLNPCLMAAWVGLLVTGLNMMPISQLDGGHIIYALFRKRGQWIARCFLILAIVFVVVTETYMWSLMIVLVTFMGADHPPTADDSTELGWFRTTLGLMSLAIPLLCFPARGLIQ